MQEIAFWKAVVVDESNFLEAAEQLPSLEELLRSRFKVERFPHRLNVACTGSKLRVQIQTDPRYGRIPSAIQANAVRTYWILSGLSKPTRPCEPNCSE